jgi:hypothetical protein
MAIVMENYEFILADFGVNSCISDGGVLVWNVQNSVTCLIYLRTYLLHGARGFLEKLTGFQLVKKFPIFYGTRRFITAFTSVRHLSLS